MFSLGRQHEALLPLGLYWLHPLILSCFLATDTSPLTGTVLVTGTRIHLHRSMQPEAKHIGLELAEEHSGTDARDRA